MTFRSATVLLCAALLAADSAAAEERRPLPELSVTALDGTRIGTATLIRDGTWLLLYVRPNCRVCEMLLAQINSDERPHANRIAVVVGEADADSTRALALQYSNMTAARWFTDADGSAGRALRVAALPSALGMRQAMIEWRFTGILPRPQAIESILFSWLERP